MLLRSLDAARARHLVVFIITAAAFPGAAVAATSRAGTTRPATSHPATRPASAADLRRAVAADADAVVKASAAVADLSKLRAGEKELAAARGAAWGNIRNLTGGPKDGTVKAAKQNHDKLSTLLARLNTTYGHQSRAAEALARRRERLAVLRKLDPAVAAVAEADTDRLTRLAEAAIGCAPDLVAEYRVTDILLPPEEEDRRGLWLYVMSRRIEAYNRAEVEPVMERGEVQHARRLNGYRELLGLLPLELDARLVQSARRHSKEMTELGYFSHESPTEGLRSFRQRMSAAGYDRPADENLHMGRWDADDAFWKLFYSPGHHRAMVSSRYTALGVGRWDVAWSQNFGAGERLMLAAPEQRAGAKVKGQVLGPQRVDPSKKHGPLDVTDVRIYDPLGPKKPRGDADAPREGGRREPRR